MDSASAAACLADDVLFPAAATIEASGQIPPELFDRLAEQGFYAVGAPADLARAAGIDVPDDATRAAIIEAFAGGCLSAAFVWLQHRGALRAVAASPNTPLSTAFGVPMATGRVRAGLAIGSATRPLDPPMLAQETAGGWRFYGTAPWVTGWGMIDLVLMTARTEDGQLIWALVDAVDSNALRARPLKLIAVQASGTVQLEVPSLQVPRERVVLIEPYSEYLDRDVKSLVFNGFLATGVVARALRLLGPENANGLPAELDAVRARLLTGDPSDVPAARAAASELAMRATTALAVHEGARSVLADSTAGRLVREATFLLSFGTRASIKSALSEQLTHPSLGRTGR